MEIKTLQKKSFKFLANTFSDLVAILNYFFCRRRFFHTKIPDSLPVSMTVYELWK